MGWMDAPLLGSQQQQPEDKTGTGALWQQAPVFGSDASQPTQQAAQQSPDETKYYPNPIATIANIPKSGAELASGLYQTVRHPIETGQKLHEAGISGVEQYIKDRYGSWSNAMKTIETDPLGFAADLSMGFEGAGAALRAPAIAGSVARGASIAGKAGEVAGKAAAMTDPFRMTGKAVAKGGKTVGKVAENILGTSTQAGKESIGLAFEAGTKGGAAGKALTQNMRKKVGGEEAVAHAREAFHRIIQNRSTDYNGAMRAIRADTRTVPFTRVDAALDSAREIGRHVPNTPPAPGAPASVTFLPENAKIVNEMSDIVDKWKNYDPAYHTLGGFNDMKRELGEYVAKYDIGTPQHSAAMKVYDGVKKAIIDEAPQYADVMNSYDKANDFIRELTKTLNLSDKSTVDTALRKLQSTLRDTAHSNYGVRANLVQALVDNGADTLLYEIAGQTLRPALRSNVGTMLGGMGAVGAALGGWVSPKYLLLLATFSPRLMGEASYKAGQVGRLITAPTLAVNRALNRVFPSLVTTKLKRPIILGASRTGEIANSDVLKAKMQESAKRHGYNMHPRVLDRLATQMLSPDQEENLKAVKTIGKHKRLMSMINDIGRTKGEQ